MIGTWNSANVNVTHPVRFNNSVYPD